MNLYGTTTWYNGTNRLTGAQNESIGGGVLNTAIEVAIQIGDSTSGNFAALECEQYNYLDGNGIWWGGWYLQYMYTADGTKIQEVLTTSGGTVTTKDYIDEAVYVNTTLSYLTDEEGRVTYNSTANTMQMEYSLRDHLGNTRACFADVNGNGTVEKCA